MSEAAALEREARNAQLGEGLSPYVAKPTE